MKVFFFMKTICRYILVILLLISMTTVNAQNSNAIRIIMLGAHPDDCDQGSGGTAAIFAQMGYAVKFVSVTNGDAGHQTMKGIELAKRRFAEAQDAGKRLGVVYDVLDNHDRIMLGMEWTVDLDKPCLSCARARKV